MSSSAETRPVPPVAYRTVSILSDLGRVDESAGVLESVVRDLAPHAAIIHLTHEVPPHDVRAGSLALARAIGFVPSGVVLAAVDAGTWCDRPMIAVEVADAQGVLIGPDNGLLAPAVAMAGGAERTVVLDNDEFHLAPMGALLPARDILAAIAAHLCNGVALEQLGTAIEAERLLPGMVPLARPLSPDTPEAGYEAGVLCDVLWVDRFGACQLNLGPDDLPSWAIGLGSRFLMRTVESGVGPTESSVVRTVERVPHAGTLGTGSIGLADDPYGMVALVLERRSAAEELGLNAGDQLVLEPLDADDTGGPSVPVTLRPSR